MAESTATLPDDVLAEILLRLDDLATLFRCTATCKPWRSLVANPHFFLRRRWPPSLVGIFTKRCLGTGTSPTDSSSQLSFVPLPGSSVLGTRPRSLSSFLRADDAAATTVVDSVRPLATRGGLLLVRLYLRDHDHKPKTPIVGLAVCNPFAGTWDVLPELNCESRFGDDSDYGCIASDGSPTFKVLMIGKDKYKSHYNLHIFSSGEAEWRAPTTCFNMMVHKIWSMENTGAVMCRGYAHWLFVSESNRFHILKVDVETGHVSLTKLLSPTKQGSPLAGIDFINDHATAMENIWRARDDLYGANRLATTTDGRLLSLCVYRGRRLEIWTQQQDVHNSEDGDAAWHNTRVIDQKLTELIQQLKKPSCIWSGERTGTLFLITDCKGSRTAHIAHLDTGTLEDATDLCGEHVRHGILPMEIDWPTFFMSRLGGSYCRLK